MYDPTVFLFFCFKGNLPAHRENKERLLLQTVLKAFSNSGPKPLQLLVVFLQYLGAITVAFYYIGIISKPCFESYVVLPLCSMFIATV